MSARRNDFIATLLVTTQSRVRALDHDARTSDLLNASITENVVAAIHYLEHGDPEDEVEAPTAALAYARALAQRDVPLSALVRAYRIGHNRFLNDAMAVLTTHSSQDQSLPAAAELVQRAAWWIDRVCEQAERVYEHERDRWLSSRSGVRQHWVNDVLAGAVVDIGRAEEALEYRLNRRHVAAVLWPDETVATRDVAELFDGAKQLITPQLDTDGPALMVPADKREARLWCPLADGPIDYDSLVSTVNAARLPVRVAVGGPGRGIDGFRRTLREAEQAKVVAVAGGDGPDRVVTFAAVAPIALMATDMAELRYFVGKTLGELAADDARNRWLRETLHEFLVRNRSYTATADALFLHRNTIHYRVTQAMNLCGACFEKPDTVLHVQIALLACRWMGRRVLAPPTPPVDT